LLPGVAAEFSPGNDASTRRNGGSPAQQMPSIQFPPILMGTGVVLGVLRHDVHSLLVSMPGKPFVFGRGGHKVRPYQDH
jgi:hypothetical protein